MALDAASGKTTNTYAGTEGTEEILVVRRRALPSSERGLQARRLQTGRRTLLDRIRPGDGQDRHLVGPRTGTTSTAIEVASGKELWRLKTAIARLSLTVDAAKTSIFIRGKRLCVWTGRRARRRWQEEAVSKFESHTTRMPPTLVSHAGRAALSAQRRTSSGSGRARRASCLWKSKHPRSGHVSPGDALVINGLVWSARRGRGSVRRQGHSYGRGQGRTSARRR